MSRNETTISGETARDYCQRFPNTPTKTLARKAYKEQPKLWRTLETCYSAMRFIRGNSGKKNRKNISDKSLTRKNGRAGTVVVPTLPKGITELNEWHAEKLDTNGTWAILSDIHIPFHDHTAVELVLKEAKRRGAVGILLNGDVMDGHAISHWQRDPRQRDHAGEIKKVQEFFAYLRHRFPHAEIVFKEGNHDERWSLYLQQKAPELLDLESMQIGELTHADRHGIRIIGEKRPVMLGKLWAVHGHEWRGGISSPVNPARGLYLKTRVSAICGHLHQSSSHSERDLAEHVVTCWSTGCLCDTHPLYAPINRWNHGAAFVSIGADGAFDVDNVRIVAGKLWN